MAYFKSLLYIIGCSTAGIGLFIAFTPSVPVYTKEINEKQGTLPRDIEEQKQSTQLLIARLRNEAGLKTEYKTR